MSARERILIIRLMNKLEKYRISAQVYGMEDADEEEDQNARNQWKANATA